MLHSVALQASDPVLRRFPGPQGAAGPWLGELLALWLLGRRPEENASCSKHSSVQVLFGHWGNLYGLRNLCDGAERTQRCLENHLCRVILCDANIRGPIRGVNATIHLDNAQAVLV